MIKTGTVNVKGHEITFPCEFTLFKKNPWYMRNYKKSLKFFGFILTEQMNMGLAERKLIIGECGEYVKYHEDGKPSKDHWIQGMRLNEEQFLSLWRGREGVNKNKYCTGVACVSCGSTRFVYHDKPDKPRLHKSICDCVK